jgi:hypothetical protein
MILSNHKIIKAGLTQNTLNVLKHFIYYKNGRVRVYKRDKEISWNAGLTHITNCHETIILWPDRCLTLLFPSLLLL